MQKSIEDFSLTTLDLYRPSVPLHFTPSSAKIRVVEGEDGLPHRAHYNLKEIPPFKR